MWHFEFDAPVGTRILSSRFMGITHYSLADLWWSEHFQKWMPIKDALTDNDGGASNTAECRSFKAFKRHLRKHPELRDAGEVTLVSRFIGYSITAKWIEE